MQAVFFMKNIFRKSSKKERTVAVILFIIIAGFFFLFNRAAAGSIDTSRLFDPCGFRQDHGLPCPTCGITRSIKAFSLGKLAKSFYIQPAGALLCLIMAITAVFSGLITVFGVNFRFVDEMLGKVKIGYLILIILIAVAAGWAVTLARAWMNKPF